MDFFYQSKSAEEYQCLNFQTAIDDIKSLSDIDFIKSITVSGDSLYSYFFTAVMYNMGIIFGIFSL